MTAALLTMPAAAHARVIRAETILPPGQSGYVPKTGTNPHLTDQLAMYQSFLYKPAGFVSYGGVSGGMRSVQMTKQVLTSFKVVPIPEAVTVQMFAQHIGEDGVFRGNETHEKAAVGMLNELHRWATALKTLR